MIKQSTSHYFLYSEQIVENCISEIKRKGHDGKYEVLIRKISSNKTLKQLGALFGLWIKEEAERSGESELFVHSKWKAWFLARIYFIEPQTSEQEMWVEHFMLLKNMSKGKDFEKHSKRISLKWATLEQVSEYMRAIEQHYMDEGRPLSIPDKYWKMWRKQ